MPRRIQLATVDTPADGDHIQRDEEEEDDDQFHGNGPRSPG